MIYNFLFPTKPNTTKVSLFLLAVRIIFGILLMNHGIQKWSNFQELSTAFPDRSVWHVHISRISHLWRTSMFDGLHLWFSISAGNDPDDLYYGSGLFCHSCQ